MQPEPARPEPATTIWCGELELAGTEGFRSVVARPADATQLRALVRLHGAPLGYLERMLPPGPVCTAALRAESAQRFGDRIRARLLETGLPGDPRTVLDGGSAIGSPRPARPETPNLVTAVVCTRDRADILGKCLAALARTTRANVEFVVVDNAPSDDATHALVAAVATDDPRFRYVRDDRPGLSNARNAGIEAARGEIVAFTDDDVIVDPDWAGALASRFAADAEIACVTGLVCTAGIGSRAEAYFDARAASWSSRFDEEEFDLGDNRRPDVLYPYSAGIYGTGANFAFRRSVLLELGLFDCALGAGTRTRGGEDLDIFVRVLRAGHRIAYEPTAVVWHHHRADDAALLRQMYGYGSGLTAYLYKLVKARETRWDVLRRVPRGLVRMFEINTRTQARLAQDVPPPKGALRREVSGYFAGPLCYVRERRKLRTQGVAAR